MALPNVQHSDKFKVIFSNVPGFTPNSYNNYINLQKKCKILNIFIFLYSIINKFIFYIVWI